MDYKKKRWFVLIASCFVALCIGSLYAWSVFARPLSEYLVQVTGKTIVNMSIVFTIANSVGPITMISGGFINDKLGPKRVLLIGGILFGAGMIGSGYASSFAMLCVTYGLGVGLGVGMIYGTIVSNTVKFFPDKAGFAGGIITACYGGSSIIVPPLANMLVGNYHVTTAMKGLGLGMMLIILASAFLIDGCPKDFSIDGVAKGQENGISTHKDYTYKEMLCEPIFYMMLFTLTCGAFSGMMIISQASPIAQEMMGFTPANAAIVVSLIAVFNTLGRLASGSLSDKIGPIKTLKLTFAGSMIACFLLFLCKEDSLILFYGALAIVGFCFGSIMGIYPGFTSKQFGRKNNSVNYGIMFIGFALAGLLGPMIMNSVYGSTGQYQPAFLICVGLALIGEILIFIVERLDR